MPKNQKQARAKAIQAGKLAQIDNLGTDPSEFAVEDELTLVENICGEFIDRVHRNLQSEKAVVTGKINNLEIVRTSTEINIVAPEHLQYIDKGVNGSVVKLYDTPFAYKTKRPPMKVFKEWIKAKNVRLEHNAKYHGEESSFKHLTEEEQLESAAYAMSQKVFKEGMKPRNVYSKEIPQLAKDLAEQLTGWAVQNIVHTIKLNEKNNKNS